MDGVCSTVISDERCIQILVGKSEGKIPLVVLIGFIWRRIRASGGLL
jgi:hypothetical protein